MKNILEKLNKNQIEAASFKDGACLVIAGAGSGKTKVLTTRIASLIENGISSNNILAITFTNKAASEMRSRVENIVGHHYAFVGTFHSFGLKVIRENLEKLNLDKNFSIIDTEDQNTIIKKILKNMGLDPKTYAPSFIRSKISFIKNNMLSNMEIDKFLISDMEKVAVKVYFEYESNLQKNNVIDFDDLLKKPVELFLNNKEILDKYQEHYKYILVDEYQDTNEVQYKMVKLLSSKYHNIFVVGDPSQSIYSFRGANFQNILNFEKDFDNCTVITLPQNYRSTQLILSAANDVIKNNKERKDLNLFSELGEGVKIKYIRAFNDENEVNRCMEEIKNLLSLGYLKSDIAIFYRTNAQSRYVEDKFIKENMAYKVYGSYYFYKRKEIKDLLAYLKLINNPLDDVSLKRIINEPKRGIGTKSIDDLEKRANDLKRSMFDTIDGGKEEEFKNIILSLKKDADNLSLTELIEKTLEKSGILDSLKKENTLDSELRIENLMEFKSVSENFEKVTGSVNLSDFLAEVSLVADATEYNENDDAVTLMTIHSSKGLEFKVVFIIGLEEGIMPHQNSLFDEKEIEEERRLMYVAITRCKERLYLLNAQKRMFYGNVTSNAPSRFISEIKSEFLDSEESKKEVFNKDLLYNNDEEAFEFKKGDIVMHISYGKGVIINIDDRFLTIAFNVKIGQKKFLKNYKGIRKGK